MANFSMCIQVSFLIIVLAFPLFSELHPCLITTDVEMSRAVPSYFMSFICAGTNSAEISDIMVWSECNNYSIYGCPKNYKPVCASNGVTYGNFCKFCRRLRKSDIEITFKHNGPC